ncbi:MAG: metallophosphoesterase [Thermodesulfovibrionales bacterium]|nr:metallophosphoesterase [Thermodesulfovibrionales bacterium]
MIVGIISDTHDHLDNLKRALKIFEEKKVGHIIHAGDFCSPFTWRVIKHFKGGFTGIFGNNDGEKVLLKKLFQERIYTQPYKFTLHNRGIVIIHEPDVADELAESRCFDLIVFGHTHEPVIKRVRDTLIVNPGEVCGWLYGKPTAAIINLETMDAEVVPIA